MANSFVLMKTEEKDAMGKLNKIPEVVEVNSLYGKEYNLMAEVETGNRTLKEIIEKEIKKIPGISVMKILNG